MGQGLGTMGLGGFGGGASDIMQSQYAIPMEGGNFGQKHSPGRFEERKGAEDQNQLGGEFGRSSAFPLADDQVKQKAFEDDFYNKTELQQ